MSAYRHHWMLVLCAGWSLMGCYAPLKPLTCTSDLDCTREQQCVESRCVPRAGCVDDAGCPSGQTCASGRCTTPPSSCAEGSQRACYRGPFESRNRGLCKDGKQSCVFGTWSICVGDVQPRSRELCGNGLDDDCNGRIDDGCHATCTPGQSRACKRSGPCPYGSQTCSAQGAWSACAQSPEACNGIDDDCDGQIDEGCDVCTTGQSRPCGNTKPGECPGTQLCIAGQWFTCNSRSSSPEICDDIDNDCDGQIDEASDYPCGGMRRCIRDTTGAKKCS